VANQPVRTLTYEPRRFRFNGASIALMLCGLLIFVLFLVLGSPWRYVAASVAVVPTAWAVRRAFRISLVVTEDRVTVKNYWRTYAFPWSKVEGVGVALKQQGVLPQPALAFKLQSGAVFAQATPFRKSERQEFQAAVLALAPSAVVPPGGHCRADRNGSRSLEQVSPLVAEESATSSSAQSPGSRAGVD
jgi:Bacterial PH domain